MFDPRLGYDPNFLPFGANRMANASGAVEIRCSICGKIILTQQYKGFSTVRCAVCQAETEKGRTPEEILAQQMKTETEERLALYEDLKHGVKVHGLVKAMKEVVQEVRKAATARRRSPLFAKKDAEATRKTRVEKKEDE
jgi:phage FluMu protein Com